MNIGIMSGVLPPKILKSLDRRNGGKLVLCHLHCQK